MKKSVVYSLLMCVVLLVMPVVSIAAPAAPLLTAATAITQTGFTANWSAVSGATGYQLDVATDAGFTGFVSGYNNLDMTNVTSSNVSGLSAGITYYYRVRAYDLGGAGQNSNIGVSIALAAPPAPPVAVAATGVSQTGFNAAWGAVSGATGYKLDVASDAGFTSFVSGYNNKDVASVTSSGVSGLTAGTTYYYRIRAYNSGGIGANSNSISQVTLPPPPVAPVATAATAIVQTGFSATWGAVSGASGYRLDVSTSSAFAGFVTGYNNLDVSNVTSYAVSGLVAGTTYYYRVRAYNISGSGINSNTGVLITLPPTPAVPVASVATAIVQTGFNAAWGAVSGASGYQLDVATDSAFISIVAGYNSKDVANVTSSAVSGLGSGTIYYYRVRAYNSGGTSLSSNTINLTTLPATPAVPVASSATTITQTGFTATWVAVAGATGYQLDVASDVGFGSFVSGYTSKVISNITSATVSGLSAGTTYYYRVRAFNSGGVSVNSNTSVLITLPPSPAAPVATAATSVTQTSFSATWGTVSGATGYLLDVATNSGFTTFVAGFNKLDVANVTSYAVSGLSAGTTYFYRVRGYNNGGTGTNSNSITQMTLATPTATAATAITQTGFTANWGIVNGATGYQVDVATDLAFTSLVPGYSNVDVANVTGFAVSGLTPGTSYYYRVRSYNSGTTSVNSNAITLVTLPPTPAVPVANPATAVTTTGFSVSWAAVSGATGYQLDVATDAGFTAFVTGYNNKNLGNVALSAVSGLSAGTTYYYRVRAYNTGGTSVDSNIITIATVPAAPTGVAGSAVSTTGFTVSWSAAAGATGYRLDVATSSSFTAFLPGFSNLDVANVTSSAVSGLSAGTTYYCRVRAYTSGGTSLNSTTFTQATLPAAPAATAATLLTATGFTATWVAVTGATGYQLDVATDAGFTTFVAGYSSKVLGSVTSLAVSGLSGATPYFYRVRAINSGGAGVSADSNTITLTTVPVAPVAAAATAITQTSFVANWGAVFGVSGYRLDVATNSGFTTFVTGYTNLDVSNFTSSVVSGLSTGVTYYYRVRAYNSGSTSLSSTTITQATLATPVASAATVITQGGFTATWGAVSGATGYQLDVAMDAGFTNVTDVFNVDVANVTSYAVIGLNAGTAYYYRVRSYNSGTASVNSNTITLTTLPPTPAAPVASGATAVGKNGFTANWSTVSGATGYRIDVASDAAFTTFASGYNNKDAANVTTLSVSGLTAGLTYYYRVRAYNTGGTSTSSNTIIQATLAASLPAVPVAAVATNVSSTGFTAKWAAVAGADGYVLFVATDPAFNTMVGIYDNLNVANVTSYVVGGLTPGVAYYYLVRAYNTAGTSAASNTIIAPTIPTVPVASPATVVTQAGFTANWGAVNGASGYRLDVATNSGFTTLVAGLSNLDVTNVTSYAISGVTPGTTYYYRVRAYNAGGTSGNSNPITQAIVLDPITAAAATSITQTSFTANWGVQGVATGYRIDVSTAADFSSFVIGYNNCDVGNITTFNVSGLNPGTTYYYRVRGYTATSSGVSSNVVSLTTPATLNVTVSGTGGGSVHSDTGGIACLDGSSSNCSAVYAGGTLVTLGATPDFSSFFKGWSGACTGTGACLVTLDAIKGVTATFNLITARIFDAVAPQEFDSLQAAYDAAKDGDLLQLRSGLLVGNVVADRPVAVTVRGGYDAAYGSATQDTQLQGTLKIRQGTVRLENVMLKF